LHHEAGSQHNEPQNGTQVPTINNRNTNANTNGHTNGNNNGGHKRNNGVENGGQGDRPPPDDSDDDNSSGSHSSRHKDNGDNRLHKRNHAHHNKGMFSTKITDCRIPKSLEKPLKLETYDGTGDLDEHIEHGARGGVKCKPFIFN
ncbi:hypothetical protein A2U01_0036114, partial [Trifolium medium]|nr:hypothetical protein [Trifolium medium]